MRSTMSGVTHGFTSGDRKNLSYPQVHLPSGSSLRLLARLPLEFAASAASLDTHVIRVETVSEIDTALAEARCEDGLPSSSWI
jgi:hypothetical protein